MSKITHCNILLSKCNVIFFDNLIKPFGLGIRLLLSTITTAMDVNIVPLFVIDGQMFVEKLKETRFDSNATSIFQNKKCSELLFVREFRRKLIRFQPLIILN